MHICAVVLFLFQNNLISTASLIKEVSREGLLVIDFTHYINERILCPRNNNAYHISKEIYNALIDRLELSL
jgi:hypothetical protein